MTEKKAGTTTFEGEVDEDLLGNQYFYIPSYWDKDRKRFVQAMDLTLRMRSKDPPDFELRLTSLVAPTPAPKEDEEQEAYLYYECPVCEYSVIIRENDKPAGTVICSLCAGDNGREVKMNSRVCKASDTAEGYDARGKED